MIEVGIHNASPAQRRTLELLLRDLRQLGLSELEVNVAFSTEDARGDAIAAQPWLGYYEDGKIFLRPELRGKQLYAIALHEIGHHLGLQHSSSGIMAPAPTVQTGKLTRAWRVTCLSSFMRAFTRERLVALG